ncbi:MAG: enoyl-CoA hydratase [Myxococcota bacterium]|jgi:enoyl-CoA hydratase
MMRLPRVVPYGVAMEMALTGDPISVEKAHEYGLVSRISEVGEAAEEAIKLATRIAQNAPLGVAVSKKMIVESFGRTEEEFWKHQNKHTASIFASDDAKEGPRAFAEKRAPKWSGT